MDTLRWRKRERKELLIYSDRSGRYETIIMGEEYTTGPLKNEFFNRVCYLTSWKYEIEIFQLSKIWQLHDLVSKIFKWDRNNIYIYVKHGITYSRKTYILKHTRKVFDICDFDEEIISGKTYYWRPWNRLSEMRVSYITSNP